MSEELEIWVDQGRDIMREFIRKRGQKLDQLADSEVTAEVKHSIACLIHFHNTLGTAADIDDILSEVRGLYDEQLEEAAKVPGVQTAEPSMAEIKDVMMQAYTVVGRVDEMPPFHRKEIQQLSIRMALLISQLSRSGVRDGQ